MDRDPLRHLVFLDEGGAGLSLIAAAWARRRAAGGVRISCAVPAEPEPLPPMVTHVLADSGLRDAPDDRAPLARVAAGPVDLIITLTPAAAEACPALLPGMPQLLHWALENPARARAEQAETAYREASIHLRRLVEDLFDRGYLEAFAWQSHRRDLVLDSLSEGLMAHDLERRVVQFNGAAEAITGYSRADVLGRDCHDVFGTPFCGGECRFDTRGVPLEDCRYEMDFTTKDGEPRRLEVWVRTLRDRADRVRGVLNCFRDRTREHALARRLGEAEEFAGILGRDKKMLETFDLIRSVADSNAPVLIRGESGTGKELVAAALHRQSARREGQFVPVNCGALPEGLLESELFGHVRGAFTGAIRDKKGRFELAHGGTILLDEIGDISPAMQVKLLRVLQEGRFEPVGGTRSIDVDVRVVSATNKDLEAEIAAGRFREDLFYRLCVVPIHLPPLRERCGDIPLLAEAILRRLARQERIESARFGEEALDRLLSYPWPGNVRELQNAIQFALVKSRGGIIQADHLPPAVANVEVVAARPRRRRRKLDPETVRAALQATHGNKLRAAQRLGISRATLYRFLDRHPLT